MENVNWWVVTLVVIACYLASSIRIVSEQEMGLVIWWGRILKQVSSGPHFVPWPMRLRTVTKNTIKVDFGTLDVADVERANQANSSQSWYVMVEPIRINWGDIESSGLSPKDSKKFEHDPWSKRMTTDPHLFFLFRVFDLRMLVEEAGGLQEAMDRIKDTCITALQEEAGKTFVAKAVREIDELSQAIRTKVERLVADPQAQAAGTVPANHRSWGVDVIEVRLKDLGTPHRVNEAVADRSATVARATGDATATVLRAESEKVKLTREGEGRAAAAKVEGAAAASAIEAKAKALSTEGGETIAKLEALKEGLAHGKAVILPLDLGLLTAATSVKKVLEAVAKTEGDE